MGDKNPPGAMPEGSPPSGGPVVPHKPAEAPIMTVGQLIKASIVNGHSPEAKRVALDWITLCSANIDKAIFAAIDGTLELAGISGGISEEQARGDPVPFLEQLPEWVREKNLDLMSYSLSTSTGKSGKRSVHFWDRFWAIGIGTQNVGDLLDMGLPERLERWMIPMSTHGIRTLRHVAMVAALSIAQALGHHLRELTKQLDTIRQQLDASGADGRQAAKLGSDVQLLEERIKILGAHRSRLLENTIPHRNRDLYEVVRLHSVGEMDRLMRQEPAIYIQQKWTARVFLMIHDPNAEVRLKALSCIASWFERMRSHKEEVKEHLLQFAERCMLHIVDRSQDTSTAVACKAIQMLRLPVLAERMTDEEVERIVKLVSMGTDLEVRQEAALFVNAQVFQDPGICVPEGKGAKKRKKGHGSAPLRDRDVDLDDLSDAGDIEDRGDEAPDNIATLLNSETSISMFIEYLENYMGSSLRLTDRPVNAFWSRAPCLSHWHTMVSLMILGESNKASAGVDPVSTRQRLILLHVMEASLRRAAQDYKKASESGSREKEAQSRMDNACTTIMPELPRLFELCHPEDKQVLLVSHICKILIDHAESRNMKEVIFSANSLGKVLRQCVLNRGYTDVVKNCTDSLLVLSVFIAEVRTQFLEVARKVHDDTVVAVTKMLEQKDSANPEELRMVLEKMNVINQRGLDMSFGNNDCVTLFFKLLNVRVEGMLKWQEHCKKGLVEQGFKFPAGMPDTGHVVHLVEVCEGCINWYFRFCGWKDRKPNSSEADEAESQQAMKIKQCREMLPKVFKDFRNLLCSLMELDGSPNVRIAAFSSYMNLMQIAIGVSEGMNIEAPPDSAPPLGAGRVISKVEDLDNFRLPSVPVEHMKVIFYYLNDLFTQVQSMHTVDFSEDGQKVEPYDDVWPPLSSQHTSARELLKELLESRTDVCRRNDFEAEDGDKKEKQQLLRAIMAARMVFESEIEDIHASAVGQLVLAQLERSKPRPLREVGMRLKRRLRDLARVSTEFAHTYFVVQKDTIIGLYDSVGQHAAQSMSFEFTRQWGPRLMPWLEKPLFDTLAIAVDECGQKGEDGLGLLETFSHWIKGEEFVKAEWRMQLKASAQRHFPEVSGVKAAALRKFIQRCDLQLAEADEHPEAAEPKPPPTPGKRLFGKQTVAEVAAHGAAPEASPAAKKARHAEPA